MARIFDCFIFSTELELLEIRLHELERAVDVFVLAEARGTFQGDAKPLTFQENRGRFAAYADRIRHIVVSDMPGGTKEGDYWRREYHQRNSLAAGLVDATPDDVIILSDVDEIPRATSVLAAAAMPDHRPTVHCLEQRMYKYFLNHQLNELWSRSGPRLCKRRYLRSMQGLREVRPPTSDPLKSTWRWLCACEQMQQLIRRVVHTDAGWHFSSMGGAHAVADKLSSFSHIPTERRENPNADLVEAAAARIKRALGDPRIQRASIDNSFPEYVVENLERFSYLIDSS